MEYDLMDDYKIIVEQEYQTVMAHYDVEPGVAQVENLRRVPAALQMSR